MERCPDTTYFIRCIGRIDERFYYWNGDEWVSDITKANGYVDKPIKLPKKEDYYTSIEVIGLDGWQRSRR